ncbi:MAG: putative ABC transporter permease [bacterium]|nr:putative ABC transporter permease [bacterium]
MWNVNFLGFDFFFIAFSFFIYSFLGWIWETCFSSYKRKSFVNRGFLNGPIIPIYGIGGTVVYITLFGFADNVGALFLLGMLLATVLEYLTAVIMENAFHAKWWDYSDYKIQFQGRISLKASLFWGILSILDVKILGPLVKSLIERIPRRSGEYVCSGLIILGLIDLSVTVFYTLQLSEQVHRISELREEFLTYLLNTKMVERSTELKETFTSATFSKLTQTKDSIMSSLTSKFRDSLSKEMKPAEVEEKVAGFRNDLEKRFKTFTAKYKLNLRNNNLIHKRLIKAFPSLTFTKGRYYLQELKERINMHNGKKE